MSNFLEYLIAEVDKTDFELLYEEAKICGSYAPTVIHDHILLIIYLLEEREIEDRRIPALIFYATSCKDPDVVLSKLQIMFIYHHLHFLKIRVMRNSPVAHCGMMYT